MLYLLLVVTLGLGIVIGHVLNRRKPVGNLVIDNSDPDGPYMFLELTGDLNTSLSDKEVLFTVVHKDYISQK